MAQSPNKAIVILLFRKNNNIICVICAICGRKFAFLHINKVAKCLHLRFRESPLHHFVCHKLAWTDKHIRANLQPFTIPNDRLLITNERSQLRTFHALVVQASLLVTVETSFADGNAILQTVISRTEQLIIMQCPHYLDASLMRQLCHHR